MPQGSNSWIDLGWLKAEGTGEQFLSDDQLNTLVTNWSNNPNEDVSVRVNFTVIYHSSLQQAPNKINYFVGEEIDPAGLVIEVSDEIFDPPTWTKDIPYNEPQFQRLYSYQLLDENEAVIAGNTITAETRYCKFIYNVRNEHNVELNVGYPPKKFTFRNTFGYFNGVDSKIAQFIKNKYESLESDELHFHPKIDGYRIALHKKVDKYGNVWVSYFDDGEDKMYIEIYYVNGGKDFYEAYSTMDNSYYLAEKNKKSISDDEFYRIDSEFDLMRDYYNDYVR